MFQHRAAFADDDALVAVALDDDVGHNVDNSVVALFEFIDDDGDGVGNFVAQLEQNLLPDHLAGDVADVDVGDLVGWVEARACGQRGDDHAVQFIDASAGLLENTIHCASGSSWR